MFDKPPTRPLAILVTACFMLSVLPATAAAQWPPQRLENVQVFPEDIEVRELIGIMAGFTRALGVRCTYCHVGEEGQPISTYDFPSDEKITKRKARIMLGMVQSINGEHLAKLPVDSADRLTVQCATCHRGQPRPVTLAPCDGLAGASKLLPGPPRPTSLHYRLVLPPVMNGRSSTFLVGNPVSCEGFLTRQTS